MPRKDRESDREHQAAYYRKRRDELQFARRKRYETDPEYRERQKAPSRMQHLRRPARPLVDGSASDRVFSD